jgi:hypothetical protein
MAATSLLTFPYPYICLPSSSRVKHWPTQENDAELRGTRALVTNLARTPEAAWATDRMGGAKYRIPDPWYVRVRS